MPPLSSIIDVDALTEEEIATGLTTIARNNRDGPLEVPRDVLVEPLDISSLEERITAALVLLGISVLEPVTDLGSSEEVSTL